MASPKVVLVTGAAGNIAYSLLFGIARGMLLGQEQPLELRLLEIPPIMQKLQGVVMELADGAFPLVTKVVATSDYEEAFTGIDVALLVGSRPRGPGMLRKELLGLNAPIFQGQGQALEKWAKRDVKVCVVGNPANTNCLVAMQNAPSIPRANFSALTRLDQNRAVSQLSQRLGVSPTALNNVVIWGNHSATQVPDTSFATVNGKKVADVLDEAYLHGDFVATVQQRGAAIIKARGLSSAASAANAVLDHVRDWLCGSDKVVSMAVCSDGNPFGVPEGLVFSFPVRVSNGQWTFATAADLGVESIALDAWTTEKVNATATELVEERAAALGN